MDYQAGYNGDHQINQETNWSSIDWSDPRWVWLKERGFNLFSDRHQQNYMKSIFAHPHEVQAVFCNSPAGTGKTTLAVLAGIYGVEKGDYDRIIYVRNAVALRDIGFLPGDEKEKMAAYMAPFIEAMDNVQPGLFEKWSNDENKEPIAVTTSTTFTRGITWDNSFIIIDEAQNMSTNELRAVYTRITDNCKVVTTGSTRQVDNARLEKVSGLIPFEVFMEHFTKMGPKIRLHELFTNYRGAFSRHADDVSDTIKELKLKQLSV